MPPKRSNKGRGQRSTEGVELAWGSGAELRPKAPARQDPQSYQNDAPRDHYDGENPFAELDDEAKPKQPSNSRGFGRGQRKPQVDNSQGGGKQYQQKMPQDDPQSSRDHGGSQQEESKARYQPKNPTKQQPQRQELERYFDAAEPKGSSLGGRPSHELHEGQYSNNNSGNLRDVINDNPQRNVFQIEDDLDARVIAPQKKPKKKKGGRPQQVELAFHGVADDSEIPKPKYTPKPKEEHKTQYNKPKPEPKHREDLISDMEAGMIREEHQPIQNKYTKKKHDKDKQNMEQQQREEEQKGAENVLRQQKSFIDDHIFTAEIAKLLQDNLEDSKLGKEEAAADEEGIFDAQQYLQSQLLTEETLRAFYNQHLMQMQTDIISSVHDQAVNQLQYELVKEKTRQDAPPAEIMNDAEIDEILANMLDPFESKNEDGELDVKRISRGLRTLIENENGEDEGIAQDIADANQMVSQAMKKKIILNQKIEEDEKNALIMHLQMQEERKIQFHQKEEGDDKQKSAEKDGGASSSDEEIQMIMTSKPKRDTTVASAQQIIQAEPSRFNHANTVRREQAALLNEFRKGPDDASSINDEASSIADSQFDPEDEEKEVFAVVDDADMSNFDQLVPETNRAIVYPFELDVFQKRAIYRLEQGACVFVAAHTSAGKTVVAEYAIALSLKHMTKTVFTSPIKALSNQKFRDFKQKFGNTDIGILTGDVSINREATCVIMTTEVLQSQLYNDMDYLQDVEWVIFDEVHYINDEERGSVWEEVIIKLPDHISIVMLSATVPNYMEFAEWVGRTKRKKVYVQCTYQRPVPLEHLMICNTKMTEVKRGEQKFDVEAAKKVIMDYKQKRKQDSIQQSRKEKDKEDRPAQKIDTKGKAIAGKKDAISKQAAKGMSQGGGGGPNSQKSGAKKFDNFFKNLKAVKEKQLLPCVVFFFSRAQVEALAIESEDKMNFIGDFERVKIKEFKKNALNRLAEVDRELPQIQTLCKLLDRGIGFHHAGMIPLLKEMVEILFTDGLLKVVFATSTFAIGLNMPARCVIFAQSQKFNGEKSVIIPSSEYLQMAGRAGRRGKDDKGASILCIDEDLGRVPHSEDYQEMFDSQGQELKSHLKMSYKTNLNILNSEGAGIESLIKNSFFSNASEQQRIAAFATRNQLLPKIQNISDIDCFQGMPDEIQRFYGLYKQIRLKNKEIQILSGLKPFPLHVVNILTPKYHLKDVIVLKQLMETKNSGQKNKDQYLCLYLESEKTHEKVITYEMDETKSQDSHKFRKGNIKSNGFSDGYFFEYICIVKEDVRAHYQNKIELDVQQLIFNNQLLPSKQLKAMINQYHKFKIAGALTEIKPSKGKNIKQEHKLRNELLNELVNTKCHSCEKLAYHATQVEKMEQLREELSVCNTILESESNAKELDFLAKNKVLEHYKMIDEQQNILFKGKVAKAVSTVDNILITQLLFSGHLKNLNDEEALALISVLIVNIKAAKSHPMLQSRISDAFWNACMFLEDEATKLIEVEQQLGVNDEEKDPSKRLNYYFYELVYSWAKKKTFIAIKSEYPAVEEGIMIKVILEVTKICRTVKDMAILIGDVALGKRMETISELLQREIMSTQSLYFQ